MEGKVLCPKCGQTVRESALQLHLERVCPNRGTAERIIEIADKVYIPVEIPISQVTVPQATPVPVEQTPVPEVIPTTKVEIHADRVPDEDISAIPPREPHFWISKPDKDRLARIASESARGQIINVLVRGPKGCGKTTLAREFAAIYRHPFHVVHCGALVDAEQWFGKDRLTSGETWYRKARFIKMLETPCAVVLLDEVNRTHPEVLNAIFGLLDWQRGIWSDDLGYEVKVAKGVTFFGSINEGEDYFGINPLDAALRDRFTRTIKLNYPPKREEAKVLMKRGVNKDMAEKLALFASTLRKATTPIPVSTRQLLVASDELEFGTSLREAVETSIINAIDDPSMEKMAFQALQWLEDNPYVGEETETIPEDGDSLPAKDEDNDS